MRKAKSRILIVMLLLVILLSILQIKSLAANSNTMIIKESENNYIIYIEEMLNQNFEFAFSNSEDAVDPNSYISAIQDNDGNYVAYVDEELKAKFFNSENTYIWVKNTEDEVIVDGERIVINNARTIEQLKTIENITKNITIESSAENENITINGEEGKTYYYKFFVAGSSEDYNRLLALVSEINEYDDNTNIFTKLQSYNELYELYNKLITNISSDNWTEAKNLEITKPYDAKEGEQYILWLKDSDENIDVQFLTAYEKEITVVEEQEKTEEITTALPVTYDDTTVLFIALGTVIVAIIAVLAFKIISKKNRK